MTCDAIFLSVALAVVCLGCPLAFAQDDDAQAIIDQCSDPAPNAVDVCLERARVAEETAPSKDLQKVVAHLIELEATAPAPLPTGATSGGDTSTPADNTAPAIDTAEPQPPADDLNANSAPPDQQAAPSDMSPPDNASTQPNAADTEPPAPPAVSPHS